MITFLGNQDSSTVYAVESSAALSHSDLQLLCRLAGCGLNVVTHADGPYVGPVSGRVTPWCTNAVQIARNAGCANISRIERFTALGDAQTPIDTMLSQVYDTLDDSALAHPDTPAESPVDDIDAYNRRFGLSLDAREVAYLQTIADRRGRPLTAAEVYGFAQVNSEHCRHKIFNGIFTDSHGGGSLGDSLMAMIRRTTDSSPRYIVSAYSDNSAVMKGFDTEMFAVRGGKYLSEPASVHWTLKAETHNFPTTVEPLNGAATGTGGEIRDRLCTGRGSLPLSGTAVYMSSDPRLLVRASDGASDFGNKFGQPLVCGTVLRADGNDRLGRYRAFDKAVMLAGGVGIVPAATALKRAVPVGAVLVVIGGDNYRIGLGGGSVSSADTGTAATDIERQAVQRANPEMQRRVANVIRALVDERADGVYSIHDLGAGGNLNALAELMAEAGGVVDLDTLQCGQPLTARELLCNESQERVAMAISPALVGHLQELAHRERVNISVVGTIAGDKRIVFKLKDEVVFNLTCAELFTELPKMTVKTADGEEYDNSDTQTADIKIYTQEDINRNFKKLLNTEAVACKEWLTSKVDRSVGGLVIRQQSVGSLQLPLSDYAVTRIGFETDTGIATALGTMPMVSLTDAAESARLSLIKALTNIAGAELLHGLDGVSLSANWMWPCGDPRDNADLHHTVAALSDLAVALGLPVPTGKDSLSMTQTHPDGRRVAAPGTVVVTAAALCHGGGVGPVLQPRDSYIYYVPFAEAGHGSSAANAVHALGAEIIKARFAAVQHLVADGETLAVHDVGAGGLLTTLAEMLFADDRSGGMSVDVTALGSDLVSVLLDECPAVVVQSQHKSFALENAGALLLGKRTDERRITIRHRGQIYTFDVEKIRDAWYAKSCEMDAMQTNAPASRLRAQNKWYQPLIFRNLPTPDVCLPVTGPRPLAAVVREEGTNGERELAYALQAAGFDVLDVTMTDICDGRATLDDVQFVAFAGGFSYGDVGGAAVGWEATIRFNQRAQSVFRRFFGRSDTLSLGVCNGCQLMVRMGLFDSPDGTVRMAANQSGRFESAFVGVRIEKSPSIMLHGLEGTELGVWIAHAEGRFVVDGQPAMVASVRYQYDDYPGNPNGSHHALAAITTPDGRHLAIMPHPERAIYPWQCAHYPADRLADTHTPWLRLFTNARLWLEGNRGH